MDLEFKKIINNKKEQPRLNKFGMVHVLAHMYNHGTH
jgi:hypothetical protein